MTACQAPQDWGIVGGGVLGLELAWQLRSRGATVTLYEASADIGGLAGTWSLGGLTWDQHYHVTLLSDRYTREWIDRVGLTDRFRAVETKTGFYTQGRLVSLSNSWEFLTFPPLGLWSKLRLAATILHASRVTDWQRLETIPVVDWLRRWSGRKTTETIWIPLLKAKLGDHYQEASAAFLWATIARMYAARRSGLKKELFGYVQGGYATLLRRTAEFLETEGVAIRRQTPVREVRREGEQITVRTDQGTFRHDQVILTGTTHLAAQLLSQLPEAERLKYLQIRYQGIVCASVLLKRPLGPYYVTNITDAAPFTAVIEMTAMVDPAEFQGNHLVYLPKYVSADDPLLQEPTESIRDRFLGRLRQMYPGFESSDVLAFQVSRVRQVFPFPSLGYSQTVPSERTPIPGVYLVNSAQIVHGTLNVNETIKRAQDALPTLLDARPTTATRRSESNRPTEARS